jgi:YVTN family beta-propeller protein
MKSVATLAVLALSAAVLAQPVVYVETLLPETVYVIDSASRAVMGMLGLPSVGGAGLAVSRDGARAYVPVTGALLVFDTSTRSVVASISLGPGNGGGPVALSPDGTVVYVGAATGLAVIDTTTESLRTIIPGFSPEALAVRPDGAEVYAATGLGTPPGLIFVVEATTDTVAATIPVGTGPRAIAFAPDGAAAYVANFNSSDVSVIDTATRTVVATIALAAESEPTGIAITPDGSTVYVTDDRVSLGPPPFSSRLFVVSTATRMLVATVAAPAPLFGVSVTPDGASVWVVAGGLAIDMHGQHIVFQDALAALIDTRTNQFLTAVDLGDPVLGGAIAIAPLGPCGVCADADPCTINICDPARGCLHVPTPRGLGGDDRGCIPPSAAASRCETAVGRARANRRAAILRCHARAAIEAVRLHDASSEEPCEVRASEVHDRIMGRLHRGCPPCVEVAAGDTAAFLDENVADSAVLWCDSASGAHLGDASDGGWIPPDLASARCTATVARQVGVLLTKLARCHGHQAEAARTGVAFDEDACETAATGRFDHGTSALRGCPPCLVSALPGLGASMAARADRENAVTYCASPGGAFLEATMTNQY